MGSRKETGHAEEKIAELNNYFAEAVTELNSKLEAEGVPPVAPPPLPGTWKD